MPCNPQTVKRGVGLVEVTVSTLIVGAIAVAALNALGAATKSSVAAGERGIATTLAADLVSEILRAAYMDPAGNGIFGAETDEAASGDRSLYDDVDDYHLWQSSPPQDKAGVTIPDRSDWSRNVTVEHVAPGDRQMVLSAANDQGVKRITVEVYYEGVLRHRLRAYTTSAW